MTARLILATWLALLLSTQAHVSSSSSAIARGPDLAVRITSPLGRTGLVERVRIVAQISGPDGLNLESVRFFVDNGLVGQVNNGPPFAIEWTDDNPFEPRDISVEARDASGEVAKDTVHLKPLEVTEHAEVSGVVVDAAVHDRQGRFVTGLAGHDFRLLEDDVPQRLDLVRVETLPATYIMLVDSSQSMSRRIDFVKETATGLIRFLRPDDMVVIAPFSRTLGPITGPTVDRRTIEEAIDAVRSRGGTAILDALDTVSTRLKADAGRHVIILLTDGYDEHSTLNRTTALGSVKDLRATVYVVGIAGSAGISLKGEDFLRQLAADTGGRTFFPSRERELPGVYQRLTEEVQQQYVLGYTPTNQKADGTWRSIRLLASNPEWIVRTNPGYFAPKPPPIRPSLEFTVMNTQRELMGVTLDDLVVTEDGVTQQVDTFQEAAAPVSIVLALDSSGSMKKDAAGVQSAGRAFVDALRPEDKLALATFADRMLMAHDLTTERSWSLEAIDQYVASGGTALYDALAASLVRLKRETARRVVVVVTDGRDEDNPGTGPGSRHTLAEVIQLLKESDAMVFPVGLGAKVDRAVLTQLAAESGGEAYFPEDVAQLEAQYRNILENLRRRFVISYTSTNSTRDGAWRSVRIASLVPGTTVQAKGGYFAPDR
jgi:Ca-activated chloride channel family protein